MDKELFNRTVLDAKRLVAGQGRGRRGRYVEVVAEQEMIIKELQMRALHANPILARLCALWDMRYIPVIPDDATVPWYRKSEQRQDHPMFGDTYLHLLDYGSPGRFQIRHYGLRHRQYKISSRIFLLGCLTAIAVGDCTEGEL